VAVRVDETGKSQPLDDPRMLGRPARLVSGTAIDEVATILARDG
jgi:hypothetical protein